MSNTQNNGPRAIFHTETSQKESTKGEGGSAGPGIDEQAENPSGPVYLGWGMRAPGGSCCWGVTREAWKAREGVYFQVIPNVYFPENELCLFELQTGFTVKINDTNIEGRIRLSKMDNGVEEHELQLQDGSRVEITRDRLEFVSLPPDDLFQDCA